MKLILAGYNIDHDLIEDWKKGSVPKSTTPETISAAYARISRNPLPVNELRKKAREEIEEARASNRRIVFDMGHSSIAEHAVFNIDVLGVSRYLVEEIEKFRLCSFTEKSQRYVLLTDDFVLPPELQGTGLEPEFKAAIAEQNAFYHELYEGLRPHVFSRHPDLAVDPANRGLLEGWAKEDARYILSLATQTQLGMTLNARNLELMLRRMAAGDLSEARQFGQHLCEITKHVAPSLVRYTEPTPYELKSRGDFAETACGLVREWGKKKWEEKKAQVISRKGNAALVSATPNADEITVASLIHSGTNLSFERCLSIATVMDREGKIAMVKSALRHMQAHDPPPREFENVDLHFELTVSASCFAQIKRHRMATITAQEYDPALGITIPHSVLEIGMEKRFREMVSRTERLYVRIRENSRHVCPYILTNAHMKRISLKLNARELYHFARLRLDRHAQWDIRETAERMLSLARRTMPVTVLLAVGRDGLKDLQSRRHPE